MQFRFFFLLLFLFSVMATAQTNQEKLSLEQLFSKLRTPLPKNPSHIVGNEDKSILKWKPELAEDFSKIKNPEKIKYISLEFTTNEALAQSFEVFSRFPNLEYLQITSPNMFRRPGANSNLELPQELRGIQQLKFLDIYGVFQIEEEAFVEKLLNLPKLEYFAYMAKEEVILPPAFAKLKIKGFKLHGSQGLIFPDGISRMENLEKLFLVTESVNLQPELEKLEQLPNLKKLWLRFGDHSDEELKLIAGMQKLELLEFHNFKNENFNAFFENLEQNNGLKRLALFNSKKMVFPSSFSNLENLEALVISNIRNLSPVVDNFADLEELLELDFSANGISEVPDGIFKLKKLQRLNLSFNEISALPAEIGNLKNLKQLELQYNLLEALPEETGNLGKLEVLLLSNNLLEVMPHKLGGLKNLKRLHLERNKIKSLPSSIVKLGELEYFNMSDNDLESLPMQFGRLRNLTYLNLDRNLITALPVSLSQLKKLEHLYLGNNKLASLPADFDELTELKVISLGGKPDAAVINRNNKTSGPQQERPTRGMNRIVRLPTGFSKLKNLEHVNFMNIKSLDEDDLFETLFALPSIRYDLVLNNCGITKLPEGQWENFGAKTLELGGNPIQKIPAGIVKAPYLNRMRIQLENEKYFFRNREEILAFFETQNLIHLNELPQTPEMAEAFIEMAKKTKKDKKDLKLPYFKKAFHVDSLHASENVPFDDYAEVLFNNENYGEAIVYINKAMEANPKGSFTRMQRLRKRYEAYLKTGDTLSAVNDLERLSREHNSWDWEVAGVLARSIGEHARANDFFKEGEALYLRELEEDPENKWEYLMHLSLLELYIIEGNHEKASNLLTELRNADMDGAEQNALLDFMEILHRIQKGADYEMLLIDLHNKLAAIERFRTWNFNLIRLWLHLNPMEEEQKILLNELISNMREQ